MAFTGQCEPRAKSHYCYYVSGNISIRYQLKGKARELMGSMHFITRFLDLIMQLYYAVHQVHW